MLRNKLSLLMVLLSTFCFSENVQVQSFKLINNNESSLVIDPNQAQDLLNVDVTPGGKSVKKRAGYGLYKALATGQSIRGGAHFFDSPGNDVQVWGSSTSLYGITADATPVQIVSSATLNTTWDCADTQGNAYCVTSSRNMYLRTDGATKTWYSTPLGTMVEATPERIVVAGVSGTPNTIHFSESGVFTNFVNGIQVTSPFSEVIASQGSKITHIRWGCGKLLWWKDQSFGYLNGSDQFNIENNIVSDNVGTFDNTSALDPGGSVWFRGQDGHIWKYDCSALTKESIEITPLTQASTKRVSNLWTQTTQTDFESGTSSRTMAVNFTAVPGSVVLSTGTIIYTTSNDFSLGTTSNTEVSNGGVILSTSNASYQNSSFETATSESNDWTVFYGSRTASFGMDGCTQSPQSGSFFYASNPGSTFAFDIVAELGSYNGTILSSLTFTSSGGGCAWTLRNLSTSGHERKAARLVVRDERTVTTLFQSQTILLNGSNISFYTAPSQNTGGTNNVISFDSFSGGISDINLGWYRTPTYDTRFYKSLLNFTTTYTTIDQSSDGQDISYQTSPNNSTWGSPLPVTNNVTTDRYVRFISTWTRVALGGPHKRSSLDSVQFTATSSTGSYLSAVKNAPNLTQWSTFGANNSGNGGSHAFYMRASTSVFTALSATPSWTSQSNGGLVTISTGTYFQVRNDFAITATTHTPILSDFTVNWFEGSASDQAYSIYFDNSIWFSVAYGAGQATNNYIFKNDLINDGWSIYNFGTGGFAVQNNSLYFGDTAAGNAFKFGTQNSDNGTAINSYWKSKDFTGQDPWMENQYKQLDSYFTKTENATATVAYALNTSTTSTSFSVGLSSSTQTMIVNKKLLPSGKFGNTFNYKVSDNSTTGQWEFLGFRMTFDPQPYRPSN